VSTRIEVRRHQGSKPGLALATFPSESPSCRCNCSPSAAILSLAAPDRSRACQQHVGEYLNRPGRGSNRPRWPIARPRRRRQGGGKEVALRRRAPPWVAVVHQVRHPAIAGLQQMGGVRQPRPPPPRLSRICAGGFASLPLQRNGVKLILGSEPFFLVCVPRDNGGRLTRFYPGNAHV
jgi:hypothetical protein